MDVHTNLTQAMRIDGVADAFEAVWREGGRPDIERHLEGTPGEARRALLRELVLIDVEYRRRAGEPAAEADYLARFPELAGTGVGGSPAAAVRMTTVDTAGGQAGGRAEPAPVPGYDLVRPLGGGGMGQVWEAVQLRTRRPVALKFLIGGRFASTRARLRFQREVELAAKLEHPHIARVYDSGTGAGVAFLVMELVEGEHLDAYARRASLTRPRALELMLAVCRAVDYAHRRGVIHRDLKPSNILVTPDGQPHVLDFGLAKALQEHAGGGVAAAAGPVTIEGEVAGTVAYMSPEQARGAGDRLDTRTDVYSLGVILFELVTGHNPHRLVGNVAADLQNVARADARPPRSVDKTVGRELETVLMKALAHDPEGRYGSAGALSDDLENYLRGEPLIARPATTWYVVAKRVRKYKAAALLAGAFAAVLAGVCVFGWLRIRYERDTAVRLAAEADGERDVARREARNAQVHLARGLVAQGDALLLAERYADAKVRYEAASTALAALGEPTRAADLGLVDAYRTAPPPVWATAGRGRRVRSAAVGPGDRVAVVSNFAGEVSAIDARSGLELWTARPADRPVQNLAWSTNAAEVYAGSGDGTIRVLDPATGKELRRITVWAELATDAPPPAPDDTWAFADNCVFGFAAGRALAVSYREGKGLRLVDLRTGQVTDGDPRIVRPYVMNLAVSSDGRRVVLTGGNDAALVDLSAGSVQPLQAGERWVWDARFSPDGSLVAAGGFNNVVRLWDAATGATVATLRGHTAGVRGVAFTPDGKFVLSASEDGVVRCWDVASRRTIRSFTGHAGTVDVVAAAGRSPALLSAGRDGTLCLWEFGGSSDALSFATGPDGASERLAVSADGDLVLTSRPAGRLCVHDAVTGTLLRVGGLRVAAREPGWDVVEARLQDGRRVTARFVAPPDAPRDGTRVEVMPGNRLAFVSGASRVMSELAHPTVPVLLGFSPDGTRYMSTPGLGKAIWIWDVRSGRRLIEIHGHTNTIRAACYSPDASLLASACNDLTVRIWDAATGEELRAFSLASAEAVTGEGRINYARRVAFSPDGTSLWAAHGDGTVARVPLEGHDRMRKLRVRFEVARLGLATGNADAHAWQAAFDWYQYRGLNRWAVDAAGRTDGSPARLALLRARWMAGDEGNVARELSALRRERGDRDLLTELWSEAASGAVEFEPELSPERPEEASADPELNAFRFWYPYVPVGSRNWRRIAPRRWEERWDDGTTVTFDTVGYVRDARTDKWCEVVSRRGELLQLMLPPQPVGILQFRSADDVPWRPFARIESAGPEASRPANEPE